MGLATYTKNDAIEAYIRICYSTFNFYRLSVAKAYDKTLGEIYKKAMSIPYQDDITYTEEHYYWDLLSKNEGLKVFLEHSDCDGMFTPKECRLIYNELIKLKLDPLDGSTAYYINQDFIQAFEYCYKHRRNLYFG